MVMMRATRIAVVLPLLVVAGVVLAGDPPEYEITRSSIDGGGVIRATGGDYELSGTIGQPDAGVMEGGGYQLTGGFWFGIPPGDCEDDGDVDLFDYDKFEMCLTGPDGSVSVECRCFDIDGSGAIDISDFAAKQRAFTGS